MKILALFSWVSSAFPGTSQLMDQKVCQDQHVSLSMSFLQIHGLLAVCQSGLAKHGVIVLLLIVRLADFLGGINEQDDFGGSA